MSGGSPSKNATDIQKINYSNHLTKLNKEEQSIIDLVCVLNVQKCKLKSFIVKLNNIV